MKKGLVIFLLILNLTNEVHSENVDLNFAPLAPIENQFPMQLSEKNRDLLIDNPERLAQEKKRNVHLINEHTFPWLTLMILIGLGGLSWTAYLTREKWWAHLISKSAPIDPKKEASAAIQQLRKDYLDGTREIKNLYAEMVWILSSLIQTDSAVNLRGLTTEELTIIVNNQTTVSAKTKENVHAFLSEADRIRFAGKIPTPEKTEWGFKLLSEFL